MKTIRIIVLSLLTAYNLALADVEIGQVAPSIEGKLVDGQNFSLASHKGKVVLINFWASWCEPCREEMPEIQAYLQKNGSQGFEVLAINLDKASSQEAAKKIMANYSFQFAFKNDMHAQGLGYIWRVPSTFIVDKKGIIQRNGLTGDPLVNTQILEKTVTPLLSVQ